MKNILVSGASGVVGYGILRSLKMTDRDLHLFGTSIYEDSVAQGFCDTFLKAPRTSSSNYIDWLEETIKQHHIDMIIPGIEDDMYLWRENLERLEKGNAKLLLNSPDLISLCRDKWAFYQHLSSVNNSHVIPSSLSSDFDKLSNKFGLPFILKPRRGFASRGVITVTDPEMFSKHKEEIGSTLMAQQLIGKEEEEYTSSAFCDGKGGFFTLMTMKRKLSNEGFTEKAEVLDVKQIDDAISTLCHHLNPIGPTNFQFRKHNDFSAGWNRWKLLEINPRISSSTSIRSSFGYNEAAMAIDFFLDGKDPEKPLTKRGRAVRYLEDFVFYEQKI